MNKDMIDIIMEKEYYELLPAEREEIQEFCATEEEFNQAREVFMSVEAMAFEQPTPKAETKKRLDDLFVQTYPKVAPIWYMSVAAVIVPKEKPVYRQPLMQIAAIGLLFLLVYPIWNAAPVKTKQTPALAATKVVDDKKPSNSGTQLASNEAPVADVKTEVSTSRSIVADTRTILESEVSTMAGTTAAVSVGTDHPDGVFIAYSQPASETPAMLDLLTTTF